MAAREESGRGWKDEGDFVSNVSAFIETVRESTGLKEPQAQNYRQGIVNGKTSNGLDVEWLGSEPPVDAQVYVQWLPVAVAVWADPPVDDPVVEYLPPVEVPVVEEIVQEVEVGSELPAEDAGVVGPGIEEGAPEVDGGVGQPGESLGEGSEPGSEESAPLE